jgi:hypothetical protein
VYLRVFDMPIYSPTSPRAGFGGQTLPQLKPQTEIAQGDTNTLLLTDEGHADEDIKAFFNKHTEVIEHASRNGISFICFFPNCPSFSETYCQAKLPRGANVILINDAELYADIQTLAFNDQLEALQTELGTQHPLASPLLTHSINQILKLCKIGSQIKLPISEAAFVAYLAEVTSVMKMIQTQIVFLDLLPEAIPVIFEHAIIIGEPPLNLLLNYFLTLSQFNNFLVSQAVAPEPCYPVAQCLLPITQEDPGFLKLLIASLMQAIDMKEHELDSVSKRIKQIDEEHGGGGGAHGSHQYTHTEIERINAEFRAEHESAIQAGIERVRKEQAQGSAERFWSKTKNAATHGAAAARVGLVKTKARFDRAKTGLGTLVDNTLDLTAAGLQQAEKAGQAAKEIAVELKEKLKPAAAGDSRENSSPSSEEGGSAGGDPLAAKTLPAPVQLDISGDLPHARVAKKAYEPSAEERQALRKISQAKEQIRITLIEARDIPMNDIQLNDDITFEDINRSLVKIYEYCDDYEKQSQSKERVLTALVRESKVGSALAAATLGGTNISTDDKLAIFSALSASIKEELLKRPTHCNYSTLAHEIQLALLPLRKRDCLTKLNILKILHPLIRTYPQFFTCLPELASWRAEQLREIQPATVAEPHRPTDGAGGGGNARFFGDSARAAAAEREQGLSAGGVPQ